MKTEEIVDAARNAGFSSSEIMHRLAAFKQLINSAACAEREKFTNTQEFVTLPREAVERAMNALEFSETQSHRLQYDVEVSALAALGAALEQPQVERKPLKNERIRLIESSTHFHESRCWAIRFARAIEAAHNIK